MKKWIAFIGIMCIVQLTIAQSDYVPTKENLEARKWFQEAKFGLFIHWGVYSQLGDGEWVMERQGIPISSYEKLPTFFNPIDFNADEWVKMVKEAGMKYITITSRHHDGFSMFDSKVSNYSIVKKTPYKKDVLKALSKACKKEGIKLFFYYSLLDWHNADYFPRGKTGEKITGRKEGDWNKYISFMKAQLTELLTNYGEVGGIWFDGHWDQIIDGKLQVDWHYNEIYKLIHSIQPQCLIGNNHHLAPIKGEDFQMFERDLPGQNTTGWGTTTENIGQLPKEVCETINGSWGFNLQDQKHKSPKEIIQYVVKAAGYGSNLLLNVGPMPNGKIQAEHVATLKKVGEWMSSNGKTIYNTTGGAIRPTDKLAFTQRGKTIYLHVFNTNDDFIFIKKFTKKIKYIKLFNSREKLPFTKTKFGLFIQLPNKKRNEIDTIIEILIK